MTGVDALLRLQVILMGIVVSAHFLLGHADGLDALGDGILHQQLLLHSGKLRLEGRFALVEVALRIQQEQALRDHLLQYGSTPLRIVVRLPVAPHCLNEASHILLGDGLSAHLCQHLPGRLCVHGISQISGCQNCHVCYLSLTARHEIHSDTSIPQKKGNCKGIL